MVEKCKNIYYLMVSAKESKSVNILHRKGVLVKKNKKQMLWLEHGSVTPRPYKKL